MATGARPFVAPVARESAGRVAADSWLHSRLRLSDGWGVGYANSIVETQSLTTQPQEEARRAKKALRAFSYP
jgi:hypothetical protein